MNELIIRRVSCGLELVDQVTRGSIIGASRVSVQSTGPYVPGPEIVVYRINRSRWIFEELRTDATIVVEAEHYHAESVPVTAAVLNGTMLQVQMRPRAGYPFPTALTRVIGSVRSPSGAPVAGAVVQIFPFHLVPETSSFVSGTMITTRTTADGQYVMWFEPREGLEPAARATASRFNATATATLELGGVPTHFEGSIADQDLVLQTSNEADIIEMTEV